MCEGFPYESVIIKNIMFQLNFLANNEIIKYDNKIKIVWKKITRMFFFFPNNLKFSAVKKN